MTSFVFKATGFVSAVRRVIGLDGRATALSPEDASSVSSVRASLLSVRRSFIDAAAFSGCLNVLMLSGSIFMLQVYDRVLPGHSLPTLQALVLLIIGIYGLIGVLELIRSRLFARIGRYVEANLSNAVFDQSARQALGRGGIAKSGLIRDLGQIRAFLSGGGPSALFDLPWTPLYVVLLFLLHPWLGVVGLGGILLLTALTWLTDRGTRGPQGDATKRQLEAHGVSEAAFTGAETVKALGMVGVFRKRWIEANAAAGQQTVQASDVTAAYGALSRFSRMSLQSIVLAVGAWLVIIGEGTGGIMIASSILLGRALAPVELAISHWKGFVSARQAYERLDMALVAPTADTHLQLPAPTSSVSISDLYVATPETNKITLQRVQFELKAGDGLAVIGPSGSGKSTLVRALVGVWPAARGKVQFDGSTIDQWSGEAAGGFIGYLPQSVELFDGTIGENIARFDPKATTEAILKAASQAGVDKLVRGMEKGFDTRVGPGGSYLSVGQRQRIALARALYGDPFFVVLDEPNSALDAEGEYALIHAIAQVRSRGGIAIIVAHRPGILQTANKALVLADGLQKAFGPREEIFKQAVAPVSVPSKAEGVA